jgi:hypothetical protein
VREVEAYGNRQRGFVHVAGVQAPHNNTKGSQPEITQSPCPTTPINCKVNIILAHLRTQSSESLGRSAAHGGLAVPQACLQKGQQLPSTQQNHALVHTHCQGGQGLQVAKTIRSSGKVNVPDSEGSGFIPQSSRTPTPTRTVIAALRRLPEEAEDMATSDRAILSMRTTCASVLSGTCDSPCTAAARTEMPTYT